MNFKDLKKINNFFDQKLSNDNLEELGKEIIKKVKELREREKNKKRKEN